jgi:hypothetical protein
LPAFAAEFIVGPQLAPALRANRQERCTALPAEFIIIRVFDMAFWAFHFCAFSNFRLQNPEN